MTVRKTGFTGNYVVDRRTVLKGGLIASAGIAAASMFNINHAFSKEVVYDGGVFDAGGATINIGEWGGGWKDFVSKALTDQFEKDFNCKVNWDSSFPWFPKFVTGGPKHPVFDVCNWNLPNLTKTKQAGDYFLDVEEVKANVPNANRCWDFAFASKVGVTWAFNPYVYAYRTDQAHPAPNSFKSFWESQFANKRGTYITTNGLYHGWFMATAKEFGKDQHDIEAALKAIKDAMPMKISEFTFNMLTMLERGEVDIAVHDQGEALSLKDKGEPVDVWEWSNHLILTQTKTISRYSEPTQKKLALALLNRTLEPSFLEAFGNAFMWRPTNRDAKYPDKLVAQGQTNSADVAAKFWVPDWDFFVEHQSEIVDRSNEIFGL